MSYLETSFSNVTVWVADGQATPELDYGTRLVEQFTKRGIPVERREFPEIRGDEPLSSGLHVLSGGMTSVNDNSSWMPAAKTLVTRMIKHANQGDLHLFGVCLGSQIIANCLAPRAIVSGPVINAGLVEIDWVPSEEASSELTVIPAFHYEQIDLGIAQKAGIEVVASGPNAPVIAYRYGNRTAGIQLHPELGNNDTFELLDHNSEVIANYGSDPSKDKQRSEKLSNQLSPRVFQLVVEQLLR